jgi:protein-S-isoprenylcysteine O-methyltransferase Ste14
MPRPISGTGKLRRWWLTASQSALSRQTLLSAKYPAQQSVRTMPITKEKQGDDQEKLRVCVVFGQSVWGGPVIWFRCLKQRDNNLQTENYGETLQEKGMKIVRSIATFLYTQLICLGLPLLGWGIDELPSFFAFPPFIGYAISIAAFGLLAGYMIQRPGGMGNTLGKGQENRFVPRQRVVRIFITAMLFGALVFVPFADRRVIGVFVDHSAMRWSGLVLAILGMGLIFWSSWALGRLYSPEVTLQNEHHLISDGLYRFIRHPRYLGGLLQGIGLSLLFRSWIGLILTLVFLVIVLFRIKDEEAMMSKAFGLEWEAYCKRSWRLLPFIF